MSDEADQRMHSILVEKAGAWLARQGCSVVITDMSHSGSETPDAIGWRTRWSMLVECKASRADFLADAHKHFRREPERGMAHERYYLCPEGVITEADLPPKWGLLNWRDGKVRCIVKAEHQPHCSQQEVSLLVSAIRRIGRTAPTGISCKFYTMESKNRATLGCLVDDETEAEPAAMRAGERGGVRLLALDPGTEKTGCVLLCDGGVKWADTIPNSELLEKLTNGMIHFQRCAIEMVACYGMPVGREVFETCVWIGRFHERAESQPQYVYRRDVKIWLCNSMKAKDANIRQALLDKYGPVGTKKNPGPLFGISGHLWSALAVADYALAHPIGQPEAAEG